MGKFLNSQKFLKIFSIKQKISSEKLTPKQESAIGSLVTANQNIIDLIARRYSSPSETLAKANATRKSSASDVALKIPEKSEELLPTPSPQISSQSPQTPTSPSNSMLNKLSPGNIFKNIFK